MRVRDILEQHSNSKKPAFIYRDRQITYSEMYENVKVNAGIFAGYGMQNCNIGIFIQNSIDYVIAYFTILNNDSIIVPIDARSKQIEITNAIVYCNLSLIITNNDSIQSLKKIFQSWGHGIYVYNISSKEFEAWGGCVKVLSNNERDELKDVALILHTSGSLSSPKRVMLTDENLLSCTESIIESLRIRENDTTLISLPLHLASANTSQLLTHLKMGATCIIMDTLFTGGMFFKLVEKHKITNFTGVPYMMLSLIEDGNKDSKDISSLRFVCFGGAPTPAAIIKELMEVFPSINFIHMYGQTEASTRISHLLPPDSVRKLGSVGKPIPGVEWRLVDENGNDTALGEVGEVIVRGRNIMRGYYKRNEETEKAIRSGWLYTGDMGRLDADGFLYITGRKKNVIIKGGTNIYPEEVEELLCSHPAVKEVCVSAEKNELFGEVPVARIVLKDGYGDIKESEFIDYCCRRLSRYKIPEKVELVDCIPKTAAEKIMRH